MFARQSTLCFLILVAVLAVTFPVSAEELDLHHKIARATISALTGHKPAIMNASAFTEPGIELVTYKRNGENTLRSYLVKFQGNRVVWARYEGQKHRAIRWRESIYDEVFKYRIEGDKLTITAKYSGHGAGVRTVFLLSSL